MFIKFASNSTNPQPTLSTNITNFTGSCQTVESICRQKRPSPPHSGSQFSKKTKFSHFMLLFPPEKKKIYCPPEWTPESCLGASTWLEDFVYFQNSRASFHTHFVELPASGRSTGRKENVAVVLHQKELYVWRTRSQVSHWMRYLSPWIFPRSPTSPSCGGEGGGGG